MARSHESPMDFQWQQGFGPSGADSPFLKSVTNNHSPPKPSFPTTNRTNSQSSTFHSTPSTKMPPQFRNPSFTTPQKSPDLDFSSGPENQSSPANGDTEDTPEPLSRNEVAKKDAMIQFKAAKKQPALGIFGRYGMSGRGEIVRRSHNEPMARRIHKRKRRDADRDVKIVRRRPSDESDSEFEDHGTHSAHKGQGNHQQNHQVGAIAAFFSYLETHPNLPHILSYYAQFLLNFFLVAVLIYMVYAFWSTIRSDVNEKSKEAASQILVEMAACARDFKDNKCGNPDGRVPAMESVCNSWEKCMQRDPTMVGRAKVSAHTFAEIINNFFQPISGKAMISLCVLFLGCLAVNNVTMYLFRHKTHPAAPPSFPPPAQYPQTPAKSYAEKYTSQFYTPYQHRGHMQKLEYANVADNEGRRSPIKRLQSLQGSQYT
ncbi:MAG: hypothetical protein L6R37_001022 [Teloschistes peruensis]|nr:MAG: hypothetical protein L6R37_001022 [Teloschistes peruensis]